MKTTKHTIYSSIYFEDLVRYGEEEKFVYFYTCRPKYIKKLRMEAMNIRWLAKPFSLN